MPETEAEPRPVRPLPPTPPIPPIWARGELAWPFALFAGFAGAWAGLASGVYGLAALFATLALAPLYLGFQGRGEPKFALVAALGGALGAAGAVLGAVFEGGAGEVLPALLGSRILRSEVESLLGSTPSARPWICLLRHAGALALAVVLARPTRGLSALFFTLASFEGTAAAVGQRALAASQAGGHRLLATVIAWPPGALAEGVAALALGVALSVPRGAPLPRRLVRVGIACAVVAVGAWVFARPWGRLAARAVGLDFPWG